MSKGKRVKGERESSAFAQAKRGGGHEVHVAPGHLQLGTSRGYALLGEEFAHVIQQRRA
ncbi:MAG: eCIS core domain-containing protein, partial [Coraliomargarita sp.]